MGSRPRAWLNRLALDHRADQVVFDDYWSVVRDGKDRVRRLVDRVVECERVVVPVAVGRDDRVLRMLDGDLRRYRVEPDIARERDRPV